MTYAFDPGFGLLAMFLFFLGIFLLVMLLSDIFRRKAREYRRDMTDLYVVGKIRQLADKDGINILEEFRQFKKFNKEKHIDYENIDVTIEREMQEKIQKGIDKATEKVEK